MQEGVPAFWQADPAERARILEQFQKAGAKAVATSSIPKGASPGWIRLDDTPYYALPLPNPTPTSTSPQEIKIKEHAGGDPIKGARALNGSTRQQECSRLFAVFG